MLHNVTIYFQMIFEGSKTTVKIPKWLSDDKDPADLFFFLIMFVFFSLQKMQTQHSCLSKAISLNMNKQILSGIFQMSKTWSFYVSRHRLLSLIHQLLQKVWLILPSPGVVFLYTITILLS